MTYAKGFGGVTVVGDHNNVSQKQSGLPAQIAALAGAVHDSDLPNEEKEDYLSDLESLAAQVAGPRPKSAVVEPLWQGLCRLAASPPFAALVGAAEQGLRAHGLLP